MTYNAVQASHESAGAHNTYMTYTKEDIMEMNQGSYEEGIKKGHAQAMQLLVPLMALVIIIAIATIIVVQL